MIKQDLLLLVSPIIILTVVLSLSNIKYFIFSYVAIRSTVSIFYDSSLIGGLNPGSLLAGWYSLTLTLWALGHGNQGKKSTFSMILLIILGYTLFSSLVSGGFHLQSFLKFYTGVITVVVFPRVFKSRKDVDLLMTAFFIGTLFPALQAMSQLLFGANFGGMKTSLDYSSNTDFTMYYGFYYKYDGYGRAAVTGLLVLIYKLYHENRTMRSFIYLGFLGIYLPMVFMTVSRTLIVTSAIAMIGIVAVLAHAKKARLIGATIFIGLSAGVYGVSKWVSQILSRSEYEIISLQRGDYRFGLHGRIGLWEQKISEFLSRPILEQLFGTDIVLGPHGDYVAWLLKYGYFGLLLYLVLLGYISMEILRRMKRFGASQDYYALGVMALTAQLIWAAGAIIYTPSAYPDSMVLTWGIIAVYFGITVNQRRIKTS